MEDEFRQLAAILDAIIDNHNTDNAVPVATASESWVEVDVILWHELVHEAKKARTNLDAIRVALNEANQLQLF